MNERLIIRLAQNGMPISVDSVVLVEGDPGGVVLNGETSAWPRGLRFAFDGVGGTKDVLAQLRRQHGLAGNQHRFNVKADGGALVFTTLAPDNLPMGTYEFELRIADLEISGGSVRFPLGRNEQSKEFTLEVKPPSKRIQLSDGVLGDPPIARILTNGLQLDGRPALDWLRHAAPRAQRQACLLNLLARLSAAPSEAAPLIGHLRTIFLADVDRIYASVDLELFTRLEQMDQTPNAPFRRDRGPLSSTHLKLLRRIPDADQPFTEQYRFRSYRHIDEPSLQITLALPPDTVPNLGIYADIDIDLGNPRRDLAGFVVHLGELMNPGKTDHLKQRKKLVKDPVVKNHLHYSIVEV